MRVKKRKNRTNQHSVKISAGLNRPGFKTAADVYNKGYRTVTKKVKKRNGDVVTKTKTKGPSYRTKRFASKLANKEASTKKGWARAATAIGTTAFGTHTINSIVANSSATQQALINAGDQGNLSPDNSGTKGSGSVGRQDW